MQHIRNATISIFILWIISGTPLLAQSPWDKRISVEFSGTEIRESLGNFAKSQKISFFLDRRVDPETNLELKLSNSKVREAFSLLADSLRLGFCEIGPVAYIGPKDAAEKLKAMRTVQQMSMPSVLRKKFAAPVSMKTQKLKTPREVLTVAAEKLGLVWTNLETIPHDLWPELEFKNVAAADLLSLLLIGFDKTFKVSPNGTDISIVSFPDNLERLSQTSAPNVNPVQESVSQKAGSTRNTAPNTPLSKQRFTITVQDQRADVVLKSFADSLGLELEIDAESLRKKGISLDKTVSFSLREATANELFKNLLRLVDCEHVISGKSLKVSAIP